MTHNKPIRTSLLVIETALNALDPSNIFERLPLETARDALRSHLNNLETRNAGAFEHPHSDEFDHAAAAELYESDDIHIDADAKLSHGESGTWVAAWVFVPRN